MKVADDTYVYCAGHGEYLPKFENSVYLWEDPEYADDDADTRPDWLPDAVAEMGWSGDAATPDGCFLRLVCTLDELKDRAMSLFSEVQDGPRGGDDDTYDYWPSGVRLLWQMLADCDLDDAPFREAIRDAVEDQEVLEKADIYEDDEYKARYALDGTIGCISTRLALMHAIREIEAAHPGDMPLRLMPVLKTLECILLQKGCEENNAGPRNGYLTSVMDVVIFG